MKTLHITKQNFLEWYFNTGADDEQESMRTDLGERLVEKLLSGEDFSYSVEDAFNECEVGCIPLAYLEEFDDRELLEVGELKEEVNVILID